MLQLQRPPPPPPQLGSSLQDGSSGLAPFPDGLATLILNIPSSVAISARSILKQLAGCPGKTTYLSVCIPLSLRAHKDENGPHRFIYLNVWSEVGRSVWEGSGGVALLEEVSKALASSFSLCLLLVDQM
jgi:hypothetical protein